MFKPAVFFTDFAWFLVSVSCVGGIWFLGLKIFYWWGFFNLPSPTVYAIWLFWPLASWSIGAWIYRNGAFLIRALRGEIKLD